MIKKKLGCFAYDNGKLVFSIKNCGINGKELFHLLYDKYHIELEMENLTYGIAMTSVCDTKENFEKLWAAISEIDKIYDCREKQNELEKKIQTEDLIGENFVTKKFGVRISAENDGIMAMSGTAGREYKVI